MIISHGTKQSQQRVKFNFDGKVLFNGAVVENVRAKLVRNGSFCNTGTSSMLDDTVDGADADGRPGEASAVSTANAGDVVLLTPAPQILLR